MNCMKLKFDIWIPLISIFILHYGNRIVEKLFSGAIFGNTFSQQFYINVMLLSPRLEVVLLFIVEPFLLASCIYYFIQLKKQHMIILSIVYMSIICLMYVFPILVLLTWGEFYAI